MPQHNFDLPHHAADKVKRALDDVLCLVDDPGEKLRIALMAATIPIGAAAGILSGKAHRAGIEISQTDAIIQIMELLKLNTAEGAAAVMQSLKD